MVGWGEGRVTEASAARSSKQSAIGVCVSISKRGYAQRESTPPLQPETQSGLLDGYILDTRHPGHTPSKTQ